MQHSQDGNANPCEAEGKQPRSEAELLASLDVDAAPSPPSPPPSTSLTTPPPRSLTMTPRVHYVAAPLLSALRRKEVMQPPTVANAAGTVTIDLYSSSTAPSSSLPDTLRASTEVNSLEVEMPSRSSVHEETSRRATGGSGRAPAATTAIVPSPHHQQQQQQELRNVPHAPPAAVTAQRRKAPVPSPGSSQRRAVRPSRPRGHTGAVARHRRPDDGSTMSCNVPHLSPSSGSVAVTDGARTSASTFALTCGDSLVTEDVPGGEGTTRADTQTTTPTATAVLNSAEVRSTTEAFPSPSPPSSSSAPSHGAVRLRRAPSPPLLPAWVYALSEHVGPRVPSPPAPREHAGGEVATLHTEAAERSAGAVRAARRSVLVTNLATPLRLRTASSPSSPVTSTGVMEWRSSTAASSRSSAPQPSWHADVDRHHAADVHAGVVPVTWLMGGFGGSLHNTPTHAQRRSLTSVNTAATAALIEEGGAEDASGHPSLPVFFTAPRVAEGTQQQQQQQQQQSFSSPASDWRLERAVQAGSSAEDTLAEEERSRASLYAADEMAKPGSFQSYPPA